MRGNDRHYPKIPIHLLSPLNTTLCHDALDDTDESGHSEDVTQPVENLKRPQGCAPRWQLLPIYPYPSTNVHR